MKTITDYQILDHGVDNCQYFPGCGTAFTKYDRVVTGCGQNPSEAWEDALEQIAMEGDYNYSALESDEDGKTLASATEPSVESVFQKYNPGEALPDDCELYYYVSIRWVEPQPQTA